MNKQTPFMQMPAESQNVSMPVVVWLHSGSFVVGGAANIDPSYVMDRDLVLVVPQYRLGFLGTPFCLQLLLWLFRLPVCLVISVTPFCLSVRFSVYLSVSQFLSRFASPFSSSFSLPFFVSYFVSVSRFVPEVSFVCTVNMCLAVECYF